ncbi:uncharacterized protein LOC125822156 [Solanum verrucosum]|uniref:uncharacterized protein LOC125822156 n=1 Tax=Solanum verrucosum TaxID=315347 RepID=UPI0020D169FE|nr:uncharacterized protein LOC125822156 [Solanum verrucosum]
MNTRANRRREGDEVVDKGVPLQGVQGLQGDQVPIGNQENEVPVVPPAMTNEEITVDFLTLARAMTAQDNRDVGPTVNANENMAASRLRDFVRMNPPIFLGSRIGEDLKGFLDEIYKIVNAMGVSSREKAELPSYQLKEVAQIWLVVYAQSIKESKMTRVRKDLKKGRYEDQGQPRVKKRAPNQDFSSAPKVNHEGGGGSQIAKPTCSTCGKKHFGKCLSGTSGCYGCVKNDHKVINCPNNVSKGMKAKEAPYSGPSVDGQARNRFYALQDNKEANTDEGVGKS